jgi:hypothetical protein
MSIWAYCSHLQVYRQLFAEGCARFNVGDSHIIVVKVCEFFIVGSYESDNVWEEPP